MAVIPRTKYNLRAPDDSELVKDGAKNFRDLCDDIATAINGVEADVTKVANNRIVRGGTVQVSPKAASLNMVTITLPAGAFASTPIITATVVASGPIGLTITAQTTASFSAVIWSGNALPGTVVVNWIAWGVGA